MAEYTMEELMALEAEVGGLSGPSASDIMRRDYSQTEEAGILGNAFLGAGERAGELGGQLAQTGADLTDWLNSMIGEVVIGTEGIDYYSPDDIAAGKMEGKKVDILEGVAEAGKELDLGYEAQYSVDKLLESEGVWDAVKNTAGLIVEQGIVSAPDMVALITAAPAYAAARTTELSYERAKNNGRDKPNAEDRAYGSATALASLAVDKFALKGVLADDMVGSFTKIVTKKAGIEAGTEAVQEFGEYTGTTVGTEEGFAIEEAGKAALGGALGGAGIGGVFGIPSAIKAQSPVAIQNEQNEELLVGMEDVKAASGILPTPAVDTRPDVVTEAAQIAAQDQAVVAAQQAVKDKPQETFEEDLGIAPDVPPVEVTTNHLADAGFIKGEDGIWTDPEKKPVSDADALSNAELAASMNRQEDESNQAAINLEEANQKVIDAQEVVSKKPQNPQAQKALGSARAKVRKATVSIRKLKEKHKVETLKAEVAINKKAIESAEFKVGDRVTVGRGSGIVTEVTATDYLVDIEDKEGAVKKSITASHDKAKTPKVEAPMKPRGAKLAEGEVDALDLIAKAITPQAVEEVVEAPVKPVEAVSPTTPTVAIDDELVWDGEEGVFFDDAKPSIKKAQAFFKANPSISTDAELSWLQDNYKRKFPRPEEVREEGDVGATPISQAKATLNKLQYMEERDGFLSEADIAKKEEAIAIAEGKVVEEDVVIDEAEPVDAPTKAEVAAEIKKEIEEAAVKEPAPVVEPTPTKEKKAVRYSDADSVEDAIFDGSITDKQAVKIAEDVLINKSRAMSKEVAGEVIRNQALADNPNVERLKEIVESPDTTTYTKNKLHGIASEYGVDSVQLTWGMDNIEQLEAIDELTKSFGGGSQGFRQAIDSLMGMESIADVSPEEQAKRDALMDRFKFGPAKKIESAGEATQELVDAFGSGFTNIEFKSGTHPTRPNVQATHYSGTNTITVWYENVEKGGMAELMLHEKGIHEILARDENLRIEWASVLERMEVLLSEGNVEVVDARVQATKAYDNKHPIPQRNRGEVIAEETVAYLMNSGKGKGWFAKLVEAIKDAYKTFFSIDLQPDDLRILVKELVVSQALQQQETALEIEAGGVGEVVVEEAGDITAEEMARFRELGLDSEITSSKDPDLVSDYYSRKDTNYITQYDLVGKSVDYVKTLYDKIKVFGLGGIPTRPLVDMLDRILPEGVTVGRILDFYDIAEAQADLKIEALDEELIRPLQRYQRDMNEDYQRMVQIALRGSQLGIDVTETTAFESLEPEGQDLYKQLRDHYQGMAVMRMAALKAYTNSLDISPDHKEEMLGMIKDIRQAVNSNKGYFPFNRFGAFKVDGKLPSGERIVTHHDTLRQANQTRDRRAAEGATELHVGKVDSYAASAGELMRSEAYNKAKKFIEDSGGNAMAQEALWQTFLEYSPQAAMKRRVTHRKSVMGMSSDMVRGLGMSVHRDIRFNERLAVKGEVDKIFTEVSAAINEIKGTNVEHKELYAELRRREVVDVRAGWSKTLTKANFGYYLGWNPASALVNLTQTAIVAGPVLAANFPDQKMQVFTNLNKEFAHVAKNFRSMEDTKSGLGYEGIYGKAMRHMMNSGAVNITQAHMMTGINEGHTTDYNPDGIGGKFTKSMAFMFHRAEIANRATTAMTAFKMKYEQTGNYEQSLKFAKKITFEAQFDFSETGKARWQRSDVGNVLFAMKSYPISMAVYMTQNFNRWLLDSKATPVEKREAKIKFLGTMIMTTILGGTTALPASLIIPEIFNMLFGDMLGGEEGDDPEDIIRQGIYSVAGETLGNIVLDGLVGTVTELDINSKVSLGLDMFARVQGGQSAEDVLESLIKGSIGPVGGMAHNMVKGYDQINNGQMAKGVTTMLPAALRNVLRASTGYAEGMALTSRDTKIEDFSEKDALFKALGFNSEEYAAYYRKTGAERRKEDALKLQKSNILREYSWAVYYGDSGMKQEARKAVREYNRGKPRDKWITQSTLKRAIAALRVKLSGEKK